MSRPARSSSDWFNEASRCYVEGHQACAWCALPHQVFRNVGFGRVEYQCNNCDFHASHDIANNCYVVVPGESTGPAVGKETMHEMTVA